MINPDDIKAGMVLGQADAEILREAVLRLNNLELELLAARKVPEGWQLVPIEPTPEMLDSYEHEMLPMVHHDSMRERARMIRRHGWRTMLSAAPKY